MSKTVEGRERLKSEKEMQELEVRADLLQTKSSWSLRVAVG